MKLRKFLLGLVNEEIFESFPFLEKEDVTAALEYAANGGMI